MLDKVSASESPASQKTMDADAARSALDRAQYNKYFWLAAEKVKENADMMLAEAGLLRDAKAMLTKEKSGNCGKHIFEGAGNKIMHDFTKAATYYPYHNDLDLILSHSGYYHDLGHRNRTKKGPLAVVELGAGGAKTLAFLKAVQPDVFVPVDYALDPLVEVVELVKREYPHIHVYPRLMDFNAETLQLPECGRILVAQFGISLGNMDGFAGDPMPKQKFADALQNYSKILQNPEDRMIVSLDHNHDPKTQDLCYSDSAHAQLSMEFLNRIKHSLPVSPTFDPANFKPVRYWSPESHLFVNGYEAIRENSFTIGGRKVQWHAGERTGHTNTYRFWQDCVDELADMAGHLDIEKNLADRQGYIHQHVFAPGQTL